MNKHQISDYKLTVHILGEYLFIHKNIPSKVVLRLIKICRFINKFCKIIHTIKNKLFMKQKI